MSRASIVRALAGAVATLRARLAGAARAAAAAALAAVSLAGRALPDLLILAGAAGVGVGLWWIYRPAAPLVLGVMAIVAGLAMGRREHVA